MEQTNTLSIAFDTQNEEGTPPLTLLPAGKYAAEIVDATVGPTKNLKGQAVTLQWRITEGDYQNRLLFHRILIEHESEDAQRFGRQKFKDVCIACGIVDPVTDLSVLCFKPCTISVAIRHDKTGEYEPQNEVKRVMPLVAPWNADPKQRVLREASTTPKSFEATNELPNDKIPF
jgi:hypothetical protein